MLTDSSYLCLVTVIKNGQAKDKKGEIDYNCHVFQESLNKVLARNWNGDRTIQNGDDAGENGAAADEHPGDGQPEE